MHSENTLSTALSLSCIAMLGIWAPGYLLRRGLAVRWGADAAVRLAADVALGLAFWPLLLLVTSLAGIAWRPDAALVFFWIVCGSALFLRGVALVRSIRFHPRTFALRELGSPVFLAIFALSFLTRAMHVSGIHFPPWIDAVHHTMIVRLILGTGSLPESWDPFIPGGDAYYHWGYHAVVSWIGWGARVRDGLGAVDLVLYSGQVLNALTAVTLYAGGRLLFRRHEAGEWAAALGALVSWLPAYYVSWGRYTHLAGMLLLIPLVISLRACAVRGGLRPVATAALLSAGLILIHVRVAVFAAVAALVYGLILLARGRRRFLVRWSMAALAALLITLPWTLEVMRNRHVASFVRPAGPAGGDIHEMVPMDIVYTTHNRELLAMATAGLTALSGALGVTPAVRGAAIGWWLLVIAIAEWERRRRWVGSRVRPWGGLTFLVIVVAAVAALLTLDIFGVRLTRLASVSSAIISIYLPISLAGGGLLAWATEHLTGRRRGLIASLIVATAILGASRMVSVINPMTTFTSARDRRALEWIDRNLPSALFATGARGWIAPSYVGVDGGYWIGVGTSARTILPPALYAWSLPPERIAAINAALEASRQAAWSAEAIETLRRLGVTHIYVGSEENQTRRRMLDDRAELRPVYRDGGVVIFALGLP